MTNTTLDQIEQLTSLFDQRDRVYREFNTQILAMLGATALPALVEILDVDPDDVQWEEVRIVEEVLLIVFAVGYNPRTNKSPILKQMTESRGDTVPLYVEQNLHMSLPLARAFNDKEDIKQFLLKVFVDTQEVPVVEQKQIQPPLSREQIQQMLFFQQQTKDTVQ